MVVSPTAEASSACRRSQSGLALVYGQYYHPAPTRHAVRVCTAKRPSVRRTAGARLELADFGGQLAHRVAHVGGHFGVLARVLTVQRLERNRQLDRLDHTRAGN